MKVFGRITVKKCGHMATSDATMYDTPDRCYCSSNGECAYCVRQMELADRPYGDCATDDCGEPADSEGYCAACVDGMVGQWEQQIENHRGL